MIHTVTRPPRFHLFRWFARLMVIPALAVLTAGCASNSPSDTAAFAPATGASVAALRDADLRLVRWVEDGKRVKPPADTPVTVRLGEAGRLSGRGPVNRYFGTFGFLGDGSVSWPNAAIGSTRMAGPPEAMDLEMRFFQTLTRTTALETTPDAVRFQSADGRNILEFSR
ncbi:MAG: META domain-containing protein [Verrucomicrobiae bacterium]|nr:META domain-containing protein [Verrucomicrobiae bacterium]